MKTFFFWSGRRLVGVAKGIDAEEARRKVIQEINLGINFNSETEVQHATAKTY